VARRFRYTFILALVAVCTAAAAVGGWRYARASAPVSGPIIMVSVDALRADRLPVYGYAGLSTPAIDTLAADGVVFERAYSHAPLTLPAHASLLSGRLPFDIGVRDTAGFTVGSDDRLLAEMLRDRGYATGAVVSSYALRKETGIDQGFSFFDDELPAPAPDAAARPVVRDGALSEQIAERWLDENAGERTFLFLHVAEPHAPYRPSETFAPAEAYDAEVARVDRIVGQLVKYLKTHQLYDQSTIVFLSDHGEGFDDHGEARHGLLIYDEAVRIPLIVKQAVGEGAGRRVSDLVQHVDIVPTILDLAKAPVPGNLAGRSLKPLLDGTGDLGERVVYSESLYAQYRFGWSALASLTDGRYRYIRGRDEELYDLARDPEERTNVAADHPAVVLALRARLERLLARRSKQERELTPAIVTDDERDRFAALGLAAGVAPAAQPLPGYEPLEPKDRVATGERYRAALEHASAAEWQHALAMLKVVLRDEPDMATAWTELGTVALHAGRYQQAADAFKRAIELTVPGSEAHLGAATALARQRRFNEARNHARAVTSNRNSAKSDRAAAHALLARIALTERDAVGAETEAALAEEASPVLPMRAYVKGRLLYDEKRFDEALPLFDQAARELADSGERLLDVHFFAAEALVHLRREADAEAHYLEELRQFPHNVRARVALATLYHRAAREAEARQVLDDVGRITPTAEAFAAVARTWSALGDEKAAAAARAQARPAPVDQPSGH
jgi:arylsulfatase A-like enzyme/Tfp pilus assembly protein PilF